MVTSPVHGRPGKASVHSLSQLALQYERSAYLQNARLPVSAHRARPMAPTRSRRPAVSSSARAGNVVAKATGLTMVSTLRTAPVKTPTGYRDISIAVENSALSVSTRSSPKAYISSKNQRLQGIVTPHSKNSSASIIADWVHTPWARQVQRHRPLRCQRHWRPPANTCIQGPIVIGLGWSGYRRTAWSFKAASSFLCPVAIQARS